jgi:hypothetical protein
MITEQGNTIVKILERRNGTSTIVMLDDGREPYVKDLTWGFDKGDGFAHITTKISPPRGEISPDFFFANEVTKIIDPDTGESIYEVKQ